VLRHGTVTVLPVVTARFEVSLMVAIFVLQSCVLCPVSLAIVPYTHIVHGGWRERKYLCKIF